MDIQGVHPMAKQQESFAKISFANMEIRSFRVSYNGVLEEELSSATEPLSWGEEGKHFSLVDVSSEEPKAYV
jgi:hypothetical protein